MGSLARRGAASTPQLARRETGILANHGIARAVRRSLQVPSMKTILVSSLSAIALIMSFTTAAGCSANAYEEEEASSSELVLGNNPRTAYQFFVQQGLSNIQSAAVVGNLMQESTRSLNPGSTQPGGRGRGIAQWSTGGRWDTDANANLRWFAAQSGRPMQSLQVQLEFVWWELEHRPAYGLAQLRAATTLATAVNVFSHQFERCGTCNDAARLRYAQQVLNEMSGSNTQPVAASSSSSSSAPPAPPPSSGKDGGAGKADLPPDDDGYYDDGSSSDDGSGKPTGSK